ncbi:MAG TPA: DUF2452 domain-containing protein, partial [Cyclobacteriaceae bacterium]|nr:DUF2452 domain-containing protein [Cyclobacteriaceae bacterium]
MKKKTATNISRDNEIKNHQEIGEGPLPGLINYPHTIGSAVIRPEDMGKIKGKSLTAMREQTRSQMARIYEQMNLLIAQAKSIQNRVEISEKIYMAQMQFEPVIGQTYYLYEKAGGPHLLSMISPSEWGKGFPF